MAITDSQKIDYLWKKVGFAATKTDISSIKDATNEAIPSPLQIRGDKIMANSASIPGSIPGSNTSIVTVYTTSLPIETINDATASANRTWKTGLTDWISPEFGSTYQAKVYISPSGQAGNVASVGTQVFATGSGNSDEWFFDYQSGVLNFIGNNLPSVSFTGNSVYVSGARYVGNFGIPNISLGSFVFNGNTITTSETDGNIVLSATGNGVVQISGTNALQLPVGTTGDRPANPVEGYIRFNTDTNSFEFFDGTSWDIPGAATIESIVVTPDGVSNTFPLGTTATSDGVIVSINGTLQQPITAYNISGNSIVFTEVPVDGDIVEVRKISAGVTSVTSIAYGTSTYVSLSNTDVNIKGNIVPSANVTYSLGNITHQWKDLWVSSNTIYIGGAPVTVANGQLSLGGNIIGAAEPYGNINVAAYLGSSSLSVGTITTGTWQAGTIDTAYGGTGATTPNGALTNILPAGEQTGYVLTTAGEGTYYWAAGSGGGSGTVGQSLTTLRQSNTATAGQTVFNLVGGATYTPGAGQLRVYINGVRQFPGAYTETSANVYTLSAGVTSGTVVFAEIDAFSTFNNYANLTYASNVGNIAASGLTVQSAIDSLENNKAPLVAPVFSGTTTIGGNLVVQGNLFVNGNVTTINANNLSISDSLIYLADDNPADTIDIGIVSSFTSAVRYQHTGFVRDATDGTWKLFANVVAEPTTTVDFTNATYANLQVGNVQTVGDATVGANLKFTHWSTYEAGGKLYFAYDGVVKMSINSNGNLIVTGDITAFGTP